MIGSQNFIEAHSHLVETIDGTTVQLLKAVTTPIHTFDGTADWMVMSHDSLPDHAIFLTFGVGEHPISPIFPLFSNLLDKINSEVSPLLFKTTFQKGALLANNYESLKNSLGEERASQLMLNDVTGRKFNEYCNQERPFLNFDAALLGVSESAAGMLSYLKLLFPPQPTTLSPEVMDKETIRADELVRHVEEGTRTYAQTKHDTHLDYGSLWNSETLIPHDGNATDPERGSPERGWERKIETLRRSRDAIESRLREEKNSEARRRLEEQKKAMEVAQREAEVRRKREQAEWRTREPARERFLEEIRRRGKPL